MAVLSYSTEHAHRLLRAVSRCFVHPRSKVPDPGLTGELYRALLPLIHDVGLETELRMQLLEDNLSALVVMNHSPDQVAESAKSLLNDLVHVMHPESGAKEEKKAEEAPAESAPADPAPPAPERPPKAEPPAPTPEPKPAPKAPKRTRRAVRRRS